MLSPIGLDAAQVNAERGPQEVGQSLVALPWYWLGRALIQPLHPRWHAYAMRAVMTTFNIFITLATIWVLHRWLIELASPQLALAVAALYGLGTLAWPYSQTFYREPLVGLCLLIAFWYGGRFQKSHHRNPLFISLAAMLLAVMTKTTAVIAIPWWLIVVIPTPRLQKQHLGTGVLITGAVMTTAVLILPAKLATLQAYGQEISFDLQQNLPAMWQYGLHGLLTSPGKGLLITTPPILLALFGFPQFWRQQRRLAGAIAGVGLSFLLVYSTRRGWHGGASWGPRYLLPVLPLLLLPTVNVMRLGWGTAVIPPSQQTLVRITVIGLAALGVMVQLSAVAIFPLNYYHLKIQQGVVQPAHLEGGRTYLQELYFDPQHSPIWGQAALALHRIQHINHYGVTDAPQAFPATADSLWHYFITADTLDFWWLHRWQRSVYMDSSD